MIAGKTTAVVTFDRSVIKSNWDNINKNPLAKSGLLVRRIARQSIRRTKRKASRPGEPPKSHRQGSTPPFKMIYSLPENTGRVIVGMVGFGSRTNPVPGLHEEGGHAIRRIFILGGQGRTSKGRFTKRQFKPVRKIVRYPGRPFMRPALKKSINKLPAMWQNSIKG